MKNISLIEIFENCLNQDVQTFNLVFKKTPILGFSHSTSVEIKDLHEGDKRRIIVGDEVIFLKIVQENRKRKVPKKKKVDLGILKKVSATGITGFYGKLPLIFKKLTPREFMVYQAITMLECVDGIEELSKQMSLNRKTISQAVKSLTDLGVIRSEKVSAEGKPLLRLHLTQQSVDGNISLH
jgi:hypothetical protein